MKIGYARVSSTGQNLASQIEELKKAGCNRIFSEKKSGKKGANRPELESLLKQATIGDTILVTRLDRLGRSTEELLSIMRKIESRGAGLQSLKEDWANTTNPTSKLILTVLSGIAQFERERILERTNEGRKQAQNNGVIFGRKPKLTQAQKKIIQEQFSVGKHQKKLAEDFGVSRSTIQRILSN